MESRINAAARALAEGDPLRALDRVALRDDPPALALRGIAMAQLGELRRARELLRRAVRRFGNQEPVAKARCVTALAEVALASRDLRAHARALDVAIEELERHGDRTNATHARLIRARRLLLLGRVDEAAKQREAIDLDAAPARLHALAELLAGELAVRRIRADAARAALNRAKSAASAAGIGALVLEVERSLTRLDQPAARVEIRGEQRTAALADVQALFGSDTLVFDACRRAVRCRDDVRMLARRPVLLELALALAEAWPGDAARAELLGRVFDASSGNASWRTRLRVEIGRLRRAIRGLADIQATPRGFTLVTGSVEVAVLRPPLDGPDAAVLALLADGAAWSTSAMALALRVSQRTVQRLLADLEESGRVRSFGRGRAVRWAARSVGTATPLLLPDPASSS